MESTSTLESGSVAVQRQQDCVAARSVMSWRGVSSRIGKVMHALRNRDDLMDFR